MSVGIEGRAEPIDIVMVDKSPLVVDGLRDLFATDSRIGNVAVAANVDHFLGLLAKEKFDVAVTGWVLEKSSGREVRESREDHDDGPRLVVYTGTLTPAFPAP